jgi:hypothetical protein
MLRLSVDTGPEFSLASLSLAENIVMFGHPGISALEFAGSGEQRKSVQKTLSLRGKATAMLSTATQDDNRPLSSTDTARSETLQGEDVQEVSAMQRRRGTFINHTPRTFAMRSPTRMEFSRNSKDRSSQAYTSSHGSAEASKTTMAEINIKLTHFSRGCDCGWAGGIRLQGNQLCFERQVYFSVSYLEPTVGGRLLGKHKVRRDAEEFVN